MRFVLTCDLHSPRGLARVMRWADRWGPEVSFRPAAAGDPDVHLDRGDGQVLWNARAVAAIDRGAWAWCVRRSWLAGELAEAMWHFSAWLAPVLAIASRVTRGDSLVTPRHARTRSLALRLIGLATLCAALSWWSQAAGLVGSGGITPAAAYLEAVKAYALEHHQVAQAIAPSWLWLDASDTALAWTCALTACGALAMTLGWCVGPAAILSFMGYLSLVSSGGVFMGYQWDALVLEALVVAALLAPWSRLTLARARDLEPATAALVLARVVAFKLYFMSGVMKLGSGDPVWADWTALDYHLWTQPLPSPTSFTLLGAPALLTALCAFTLLCEVVLPWALLLPAGLRRLRVGATWLMLALQLGIFATGNFGFFNILAAGLLVVGLDDDALRLGRRARATFRPPRLHRRSAWAGVPRAAVCALLIVLAAFEVRQTWLGDPPPEMVNDIRRELAPLHVTNGYGLFANMTTERPEIEVQGSDDGRTWRTYDFAWKPDREDDAPRFAGPHMPRLDWQLWFAALAGDCGRTPWYRQLVMRLLEGAPDVLALIGDNPFVEHPPRYVRSLLWDYAPAPSGAGWWRREPRGAFCRDVELGDGHLRAVTLP